MAAHSRGFASFHPVDPVNPVKKSYATTRKRFSFWTGLTGFSGYESLELRSFRANLNSEARHEEFIWHSGRIISLFFAPAA
jgi:hypothetical protein